MLSFFLSAVAFAGQTAKTAAPAAAGNPTGPNPLQLPIMIGLLIMIFYFIILRPQKNEQRKREEMLNSVAKGDVVLTRGGLVGKVESVDPAKGIVNVNVAPKLSLPFSRAYIDNITKKKDVKEEDSNSE